jgi:hypothetical protein
MQPGLGGPPTLVRIGGNQLASGMQVPWNAVNVRPDTTVIPVAPIAAAPPGVRRCSNADVRLESVRTDTTPAVDGWLITTFVLRSVAGTECAVPHGRVRVGLVDDAGVALPVDFVPSGPALFPEAFLVRPGQLISGHARWAVHEGRARRPARLVIYVEWRGDIANEGLSVSLAGVAIPAHPRQPSNLGPWRATSYGFIDSVTDPGSLASLTASVAAPAAIVIGSVLRYSVTLTNPTTTAVPLSPCPDFMQSLDVIPSKHATTVGFRGTLNCGQAPNTISPGESVTLDYELDTTGQIPGPGRLAWNLLDGPSAAVTTQTRLTVTH